MDHLDTLIVKKSECHFTIGSNPQVSHIITDQRVFFKHKGLTYYFIGNVRFPVHELAIEQLWAYSRFLRQEARSFIKSLPENILVYGQGLTANGFTDTFNERHSKLSAY